MNLSIADQSRIDGREWAEEVLAELESHNEDFGVGFWRTVKRRLKIQDIDPGAMSDREAKEFGKRVLDFGKYRGKRYDDVPLDYLEWLADEKNDLGRYIRSRRVRAEQEEEP